jgi:hypothetical protein
MKTAAGEIVTVIEIKTTPILTPLSGPKQRLCSTLDRSLGDGRGVMQDESGMLKIVETDELLSDLD